LTIKSPSFAPGGAERDVQAATEGIMQALRNARAEAVFATPLHIVIPPAAVAIRSKVSAKSNRPGIGAVPVITAFQFSGDPLSESEQNLWLAKREVLYKNDFIRLKQHIVSMGSFM
jgi:hypothetical protein